MKQGTNTTEKPSIDEFTRALPLSIESPIIYSSYPGAGLEWETCLEISVVFLIVLVQLVEVLGQLRRTRELLHVDEGEVRSNFLVFGRPGPHYYRDNSPAVM